MVHNSLGKLRLPRRGQNWENHHSVHGTRALVHHRSLIHGRTPRCAISPRPCLCCHVIDTVIAVWRKTKGPFTQQPQGLQCQSRRPRVARGRTARLGIPPTSLPAWPPLARAHWHRYARRARALAATSGAVAVGSAFGRCRVAPALRARGGAGRWGAAPALWTMILRAAPRGAPPAIAGGGATRGRPVGGGGRSGRGSARRRRARGHRGCGGGGGGSRLMVAHRCPWRPPGAARLAEACPRAQAQRWSPRWGCAVRGLAVLQGSRPSGRAARMHGGRVGCGWTRWTRPLLLRNGEHSDHVGGTRPSSQATSSHRHDPHKPALFAFAPGSVREAGPTVHRPLLLVVVVAGLILFLVAHGGLPLAHLFFQLLVSIPKTSRQKSWPRPPYVGRASRPTASLRRRGGTDETAACRGPRPVPNGLHAASRRWQTQKRLLESRPGYHHGWVSSGAAAAAQRGQDRLATASGTIGSRQLIAEICRC